MSRLRPVVRLARRLWGDERSVRMVSRTPVEPGTLSPPRLVPDGIRRPEYAGGPAATNRTCKHDAQGIEHMRDACKRAAEVLALAGEHVTPGVTTDDLDRVVHERAIELGCFPSTLGYMGFPKSCCTSVNEIVVHGIPDSRPLEEGDIINVDITLFSRHGYHGDTSAMFVVGREPDEDARALIDATNECLAAGIAACGPTQHIGDIGAACEDVAREWGFKVVDTFAGHGIGQLFHTQPNVTHRRQRSMLGGVLASPAMEPGSTFTIEPILVEGNTKLAQWQDGWTTVTVDGGRAATAEHTVLITENGVEVLTQL